MLQTSRASPDLEFAVEERHDRARIVLDTRPPDIGQHRAVAAASFNPSTQPR